MGEVYQLYGTCEVAPINDAARTAVDNDDDSNDVG